MRLQLHWQIVIALAIAVPAGLASGMQGSLLGVSLYACYTFLGTLFLNALKMLIVPLIVSSIISGVAGIGDSTAFGRLGLRTLIYYLTTSLIAILIGLLLVNLIQPGIVDDHPARDRIGLHGDSEQIGAKLQDHSVSDLSQIFLKMLPPNIVAAAVEGNMLGLIVFSLLFGFFMTRIQSPAAQTLRNFWQGVNEVMMSITMLVMRFAPIGVFGLVAAVVAESGIGVFRPLAVFFFTVLAGLALHLFVVLPLLLRVFGGVDPWRYYRYLTPALLTAFSSASSSATLPVTLECVDRAGVSKRVASFVVPLGATVNMDGTALYECVVVMFIAQAYGVELDFAQQFTVVALALLTSIGVAGIPAASLVAIVIILGAVGLPAEAVGLVIAVDRLLDMCRTSVNVCSDTCGAAIVERLEAASDKRRKQSASGSGAAGD